jgi:hypothetical protein
MEVRDRPFHIVMDSWGRPLGHFPGEGAQGHLHMVIESHQEQSPQVFQWQRVQHLVHHQRHRQVQDHLKEQLVEAGVPGEGTHFRDNHRTMRMFNLVLPVGDVEDLITSVTAQSYNQDLYIEKERPRWEEQVAATRFTQRLIIARQNINPRWWSHQVR